MTKIDTLLSARWLIPIVPSGAVLDDHAVAVNDGAIVDILPTAQAEGRYRPDSVWHGADHVILPGLVNAHTHASMTLFRGLADDLPLMEWLRGHVWPAERRHVSEQFVRDGTQLAAIEMLRSGTTCFNDMYFFPDCAGQAASRVGIRAVVGLIILDAPTLWASELNEYFAKATAVHDELRSSPLISTAFAPHAPYTVSDQGLMRIATLAEELDIPIHIHLHETEQEVADAVAATGERPLARLDRMGIVSPRLVAVHMTAIDEADIETMARNGANVVHCPESNLKLASGICPVTDLAAAGVTLALGTDGAASNNDLDMLAEMRSATLLAKGAFGSATALPADEALYMATLGGAQALGLGEQIGSLEVGKQADVIALDLSLPETQPMYRVASQLVYAASREAVTDVWVAGEQVLSGRMPARVSLEETIERAAWWQLRIAEGDR